MDAFTKYTKISDITRSLNLSSGMFELGKLLALLNFKAELRLTDIEFVIGKDSIDGKIKIYIVDFDRVKRHNLSFLKSIMNDPRHKTYSGELIDPEYFNFSTMNTIDNGKNFKDAFTSGYISTAKEYDAEEIAIRVLKTLE